MPFAHIYNSVNMPPNSFVLFTAAVIATDTEATTDHLIRYKASMPADL